MSSGLGFLEEPVKIRFQEHCELALADPIYAVVAEIMIHLVPTVAVVGHALLDRVVVGTLGEGILFLDVDMLL